MISCPKVSIITVCYNSALYIEDAINSVITQGYSNIEYIIIDGGSIDGTVDIIQKYEKYLSFWISEKDNGISDAWNKGLQKCTGDIVGILNADDIYETNAIQEAVEVLKEYPTYGFVFGDVAICDEKLNVLYTQVGDELYFRKISFNMPSLPFPSVFMKRNIYIENGYYNTGYKTAMDYEFLTRIHLSGVRGIYRSGVVAWMRLGGESDVNYKRGYHEVMRASIATGYNPVLARVRCNYKICKSYFKSIFKKLGVVFIIECYHRIFAKKIKY